MKRSDFIRQLIDEGCFLYRHGSTMNRVSKLIRDIDKPVFYLCGPQEMIEEFSRQLTNDFKVSKQNIRVDQ